MTEYERLERLKAGLSGHWEYICSVTSEISFPNGERGRGGRMTINVSLSWTGIGAEIVAERLWATRDPLDQPAKRVPSPFPIPWKAEGGVVIKDGRLSFVYLANDEGGTGQTVDTYQILEDENELYLGLGEFKQRLKDGQLVTGIVKLRKMSDGDDFQWAPPNIKPGGTNISFGGDRSVASRPLKSRNKRDINPISATIATDGNFLIGDVGLGNASDQMIRLNVKKGDLASLETILAAIKVPKDEISKLLTIVREEKVVGDALGQRSAEWIGHMITKSLSHEWAVGRHVSGDVLTEVIFRYYGVR